MHQAGAIVLKECVVFVRFPPSCNDPSSGRSLSRLQVMGESVRRHLLVLPAVGMLTLPSAAVAQCEATQSHQILTATATVIEGQVFEHRFGDHFRLRLAPIAHGWRIEVLEDGREEDLARLTPPWHFVPNPRYIEGWHFRNAANTGPNNGSVNAPQTVREFVFSPEVGRTLEYAGSATPPDVVAEVGRFGRGRLEIREYTLTPPGTSDRAAFKQMTFDVCLAWTTSNDAV